MTGLQRHSFLFFVTIVLTIALTSVAQASTVVRTGEAVSLTEEQFVEGDLYAIAGKINISGSVSEDLVAAAGQIVVNGSVEDNAFLVALKTDIHGSVGDDLRIISGDATIAEPIMGDVLVIGGSVHILSTASVTGDVLLFVGEATIEGSVGGDVLGTVGTLRIDAPIAGDVDVTVDQLVLGDRANVTGSVRYVSEQLLTQSLSATVAGEMVRSDPVLPGSKPTIKAALVPLLILLFSVLVWYLVSRRSLALVVNRAVTKSFRPFLLGVAVIFFLPIAFTLLFVSMIGTLVSFALILGYLLLLILGAIAMSAVLGQFLLNVFNRPNQQLSLLSVVVGVVGIAFFMLMPIIGQVALLLLLIITFGSIVDLVIKSARS